MLLSDFEVICEFMLVCNIPYEVGKVAGYKLIKSEGETNFYFSFDRHDQLDCGHINSDMSDRRGNDRHMLELCSVAEWETE